jgi:hypothetical protein
MNHPLWRALLAAPFVLLVALGAAALMNDDDIPGPEPADLCVEPEVQGVTGTPWLNGLPVIRQTLEVVGEQVKVVVATTPRCHAVTPSSLPFEWQIIGPSGLVTPDEAGTLRPSFRPLVAGAYEARLTYCPQSCPGRQVGNDVVDIPPLSATVAVVVVDRMPVPPATQPVLTPTALTPPTPEEVEAESAFHEERERKCAFPGFLADAQTPQLVPVRPFAGSGDYRLLEGRVVKTNIAANDNELNHYSHDIGIHVEPDPRHELLMVEGKHDMEIEWESNYLPGAMRPSAGDRVSAFGFHTYDCHHAPIGTEIHPPVLTAVHRSRAVRIPDGWAPSGGVSLGTNIWVPGVVTDVWANVRAGEMTSNCSTTGLHQEAVLAPPGSPVPVLFGSCIRSPHPIRRSFSFNVYLPENPQARVAAAGLEAPPAPLHVRVEPGSGPVPAVVPLTEGGVTFLRVTVDLSGFTGETYGRRIVAAWVQPSPENWGLERWKAGIPSMRVYEDHDFGTDGDWVFWTSLNNRDQEWTRLLNGNSVGEGTYTFGGRAWETESPFPDRSLGPHLLLFNPRFGQHFPGSPLFDLTRSLELHTSGYDEEFWDDEVGMVHTVVRPDPATLAVGERRTLTQYSSSGDYRLTYFFERLGPVAGASLTGAGRRLADAYTLGETGRCSPVRRNLCLLLPDVGSVVEAWDPGQEPAPPEGPDLDWSVHPVFERQEEEPWSLTGMPLETLGRAVRNGLKGDPERVRRFFVELREEFDEVRGTRMQGEYARALPAFEPHLPADLWQRYLGDIDPTPVDLAVTRLAMAPPFARPGQAVTFSADVANRGTGAAAPFAVRLRIDGRPLPLVPVPGLSPGASTTVAFAAWTATPGAHRVGAAADALRQIAEPNELDNHLERRVVVARKAPRPPDLRPVDLTLVPCDPKEGQEVVFVARVRNEGGHASESFLVRFAVDGTTLGVAPVPGLPAHRTIEVTSPPWTAVGGRHSLAVVVDAGGAVAESDEGNNAFAQEFRVAARRR